MIQPTTMRNLRPADAFAAAHVLACAFAEDPLWSYLLSDPTKRQSALHCSFRAIVPWYVQQGQLYGVGQPLEGVAIWQPPQGTAEPRRAAWTALLNRHTIRLLFSPTLLIFRRAIPIFSQFDRMHRHYASMPHYYLSTIGVLPEWHGQGRASHLIRPVLAQADAQRCAVYTETMTPTNVPIYEHYGFVCQEEFPVPQTTLSIWSLYRPPRSTTQP